MFMPNLFNTAPTLTPIEALLVGSAVVLGGAALFAMVLLLTRWLARR